MAVRSKISLYMDYFMSFFPSFISIFSILCEIISLRKLLVIIKNRKSAGALYSFFIGEK